MNPGVPERARHRPGRHLAVLAAVVSLQAIAAMFFIGDALADLASEGPTLHIALEALVAVALAVGLVLGLVQLRRTLERLRAQEAALDIARGAFATVIAAQFDAWGLTAAERDVAMLALKGLDATEIAALRGAAPGTVRAQLSRLYGKAGVSGRAQFAALFVEELLAGALTPAEAAAAAATDAGRPQAGARPS